MTEWLNFLSTTVRFDVDPAAEAAFLPIRRFFRHSLQDRPAGPETFRIEVLAYDPSTVPGDVWSRPSSVIRRSNAAEFNFDAHRVDEGRRRRYVNRVTMLDTPRDVGDDNRFTAWITPGSTVQILDFIRDLVIRHEENRGTVVLHASGVHDGTTAVVVAGPKGAGKTTTLLALLRSAGRHYFSGDKIFCVRDGDSMLVYPWRDYPFVGVGTLRADPVLAGLTRTQVDPELDRRAPGHKILIHPDLFESWLGIEFSAEPKRLGTILMPEVRPGEPLTVRRLTDENERWARLNTIVDRQLDTTFFGWQSYLVPDYQHFYRSLAGLREPLAGVDMLELRGDLSDAADLAAATQSAAVAS